MNLKWRIRRLLRIPMTMEERIDRYRRLGIEIGSGCHIYSNLPEGRDCFLLRLGNNVTVSNNVTFLQHDASIGTITDYEFTDILGRTCIGDNCFIGLGSIVLPGVTLANRTIVGAGSVVTKSVNEEGMVIGGVPAKVICSVDEYINKNQRFFVNLNGMSKEEIKDYIDARPEALCKRKDLEK